MQEERSPVRTIIIIVGLHKEFQPPILVIPLECSESVITTRIGGTISIELYIAPGQREVSASYSTSIESTIPAPNISDPGIFSHMRISRFDLHFMRFAASPISSLIEGECR